jgi:hypothetical protein
MTGVLLVVVFVILGAGTFFTLRWFTKASRPSVEPNPRHAKSNPHDAATTAQLKRFFEGKVCAACSRPIAPVHAGELRPGLLNTQTQEAIAWADIPTANLSFTLESHDPLCSHCAVVETFRREHPELVVDRHRTLEYPSL